MIKFLFGVLMGIILTIYFQEDLTNATTSQFDVKGPISNPVLERIN